MTNEFKIGCLEHERATYDELMRAQMHLYGDELEFRYWMAWSIQVQEEIDVCKQAAMAATKRTVRAKRTRKRRVRTRSKRPKK